MTASGNTPVTLTASSVRVLQSTVDEVKRLKSDVQQIPRNYLPGMPEEIIVPRSYDSGTEIYTVDLYIRDPATETYVLMLEDQTAETLPDTL